MKFHIYIHVYVLYDVYYNQHASKKKKSYFLTQDNDTSGNTGYTGAGTPYVSDSCLFK